MAAAHPLHVALQLAIARRERQAAGMAEPVAAWLQLVVDAHPLVEHEAFALPAAAGLGHIFQVLQDPALEVVDPLKALLQQVGGGLLAADAAGAEQGQGLGLAFRHQGPQVLLHPSRKLAKRLGAGINGPLEAAQRHFVGVAGVDHQGAGIGDQPIPILGPHVGAHWGAHGGPHRGAIGPTASGRPSHRLHRRAAHGDDLALEPHLEPMEGLLGRPAQLGGEPLQARAAPQQGQQILHPRLGSADRAVHPLVGQKNRAKHLACLGYGQQLAAQVSQALHGGKGVKGRHLQGPGRIHQDTRAFQGATPAAASSSWSSVTPGLAVVSRVSP